VSETVVAPAVAAFAELDRMVRHLGEELAFFRRRALDAERRVRELSASAVSADGGAAVPADDPRLAERVARLEAENAELRARLAEAAGRTRAVTDRMRFLRQQQEASDDG
jgi:hypothetical protein